MTMAEQWKAAADKVRAFAAQYGVTDIYWGTGYPIHKPHAVASCLDAWSGAGMGYFVSVYPEPTGETYNCKSHMTTIYLTDKAEPDADSSNEQAIQPQTLGE